MSGPRHIIKNQVILTAVPTPEVGIALQKQWKEVYYTRILPLIDRVFSEYSSGDEVIRIDTLDLDLGPLDPVSFGSEIERKVETAIRKALDEKLPDIQEQQKAGKEKRMAPGEAREEYLFHFLRHGTLPWWAKGKKDLNPSLALDRLMAERPAELFFFLETEGKVPAVIRRLILQVPPERISLMVGTWSKRPRAVMDHFWQAVSNPPLRDRIPGLAILSWLSKLGPEFRRGWQRQASFAAMRRYIQERFSPDMQESLVQSWLKGADIRARVQQGQALMRSLEWEEQGALQGFIGSSDLAKAKIRGLEALRDALLSHAMGGKALDRGEYAALWIESGIQAITEVGMGAKEAPALLVLHVEGGGKDAPAPQLRREVVALLGVELGVSPSADGSTIRAKARELLQKQKGGADSAGKEGLQDQKDSVSEENERRLSGEDSKENGAIREERSGDVPDKNKQKHAEAGSGDQGKSHDPEELSSEKNKGSSLSPEKKGASGEGAKSPEEEIEESKLKDLARELRQQGMQGGAEHERKAMDFIKRMQDLARKKESPASKPVPWREKSQEEYFIENAGIVLLWPFLSRYFDHCGLMKGGEFVDDLARERGVHLLQFLVSGLDKAEPEYNLVLNKIFCGLAPASPIGMDFTLKPEEKEQGEQVLQALISHWEKVKSTSIDGLRGSFLLREGSVTAKDGGWLVRIARKPYDILIDYLPFGIGTIKLSYLDEIIFTEW